MVIHMYYNLNVDKGVVTFFTSKFITCFQFHFGIEIQITGEVIMYIKIWAFKVKCTHYGICGQTTFKNARAFFFFFLNFLNQDGQQ